MIESVGLAITWFDLISKKKKKERKLAPLVSHNFTISSAQTEGNYRATAKHHIHKKKKKKNLGERDMEGKEGGGGEGRNVYTY